jgi:cytoplasmic tRNA 2-thiolation protein 2
MSLYADELFRTCFEIFTTIKFRRTLEPSINEIPDGPRRKAIKASGNLCIGFSGGLGSTVLLDLVHRMYFSYREGTIDPETGKAKGGKDHPRNDIVWPQISVCYVEISNAIPGVRLLPHPPWLMR